MAPRKGFSPFTRVISDELNSLAGKRKWYVLSSRICGSSPAQYYKKSSVVEKFPVEFRIVRQESLRLVDNSVFDGKAVSESEVVVSSFGFLAVLLQQQFRKSPFMNEEEFDRFKSLFKRTGLHCLM